MTLYILYKATTISVKKIIIIISSCYVQEQHGFFSNEIISILTVSIYALANRLDCCEAANRFNITCFFFFLSSLQQKKLHFST